MLADGAPAIGTLLCVHGNPTWSFTWRDVIKGVRDRYRCIAIDLPGFGLSSAPAGYGFKPQDHARVLEAYRLIQDIAR